MEKMQKIIFKSWKVLTSIFRTGVNKGKCQKCLTEVNAYKQKVMEK